MPFRNALLAGLLATTAVLASCKKPCTETTWYRDADGDGLGDPAVALEACEQPAGYVANADDPDDTSTAYTQYGVPFEDMPATEDIVMYEVNLRAFSPGRDLQEVIDRLDHIESLGVNVIWLMPIYPIGVLNSVNSPYCIMSFLEVHPEFGDLGDLRALTDAAHARGMAVILDWVANHTSWDNPWIENEDWYTQDASGNIIHPPGTNWMDVADLSYGNDEMRHAMIDAMRYWVLEANVDGYRCDAADFVPFNFWSQALDSLFAIPNRELVMLAEGARADHFTAGFQLNFGWNWYGEIKEVFEGGSADELAVTHDSEYGSVPPGKHKLRFTTNHDESAWDATPVALFGGIDGALAASAVTTYMGGVPLIYGSQEMGTPSPVSFFNESTISWSANPDMQEAYRDMMAFYNASEAARAGELIDYSTSDIALFSKTLGGEEVAVLANVRDTAVTFTVPGTLQGPDWEEAFDGGPVELGATETLQGYEWMVLRR